MAELPKTGCRFRSSLDCVTLVKELINKKGLVERECQKRHAELQCPQRIHDRAIAVMKIEARHEKKNFFHFESEEGYIRELGEWLIMRYAEVTCGKMAHWEFRDEDLRQRSSAGPVGTTRVSGGQ